MESKLKATDLMIGDWVIDYKDRFVRVHGIEPTWNEIWVNYANGSGIYKSNVDFTKPIPLTTELLEKCENAIFPIKHLVDCIVCDLSLNYDHTKKIYFKLITGTRYYFNYLHQLQQLIRLLTKQELIINL